MSSSQLDQTSSLTRQLALAETALTRALREERKPAPRKLVPRALPVLSVTRPLLDDAEEDDYSGGLAEREDEGELFAHEIRALPDIVAVEERAPRAGGFTVTERLESNRRERYDVAISEMHQELEALKRQTEAQIVATTCSAKEQLDADADEALELFEPFADDADCVAMTLPAIDEAGVEIAARSQPRQEMIGELVDALHTIEAERAERAATILKTYGKLLVAIAYSLQPDVERALLGEAQLINGALLENKRAIADLQARLLTAEVVRDRKAQVQWQGRRDAWISLKRTEITDGFLAEVERMRDRQAGLVERELEVLARGLAPAVASRSQTLGTVALVVPDAAEPNSMADHMDWMRQLLAANVNIGEVQQQAFNRLAILAQDERRSAEAMLQQCQIVLVRCGASGPEEVKNIVGTKCQPTVLEHLEVLDRMTDELGHACALQRSARVEAERLLGQRLQQLAEGWDSVQEAFSQTEDSLRESLNQHRAELLETQNETEKDMDVVIDSIRQASTPASLAAAWQSGEALLGQLSAGHVDFKARTMALVEQHPVRMHELCKDYHDGLCAKLYARRDDGEPAAEEPAAVEEPVAAGEPSAAAEPAAAEEPPPAAEPAAAEEPAAEEPPPAEPAPVMGEPEAATELATAPGGEPGAQSAAASSLIVGDVRFVFQDEPTAGELNDSILAAVAGQPAADGVAAGGAGAYVASAELTVEMVVETVEQIRVAWLTQLVAFERHSEERARETVANENGVIDAEFTMQQHLHKSRCSRLKTDVHNVRAAEFALHRERIAGHCNGMEEALRAEKERFDEVCAQAELRTEVVSGKMESLKAAVASCQSVKALNDLLSSAQALADSFRKETRSTLREERQLIEEVLRRLRESNGTLRTSLRTFSEGGNFSIAEIEEFKVVLKLLAQKVDETEGVILKVLNGMEVKQNNVVEQGMEQMHELHTAHIKDVQLVEQVRTLLNSAQVQVRSFVAADQAQAGQLDTDVAALTGVLDLSGSDAASSVAAARKMGATLRARLLRLDCLRQIKNSGPTDVAGVVSVRMKSARLAQKVKAGRSPGQSAKLDAAPARAETGRSRSPGGKKSRQQPKRYDNQPVLEDWEEPAAGSLLEEVNEVRVRCRAAVLNQLALPYYELLRGRPPTRGAQIADSVQPFIEGVEAQLNAIYSKAVAYRKQSVIDFMDIVRASVKLMSSLAGGVFDKLAREQWEQYQAEVSPPSDEHRDKVEEWLAEGTALETSLRPVLGHPSNVAELEQANQTEAGRYDGFVAMVNEHYAELNATVGELCNEASSRLNQLRTEGFGALDDCILPNEVLMEADEKKKSLKKLLKEQRRRGVDSEALLQSEAAAQFRAPRPLRQWPVQPCYTADLLAAAPPPEPSRPNTVQRPDGGLVSFDQADADQDGALSREEFCSFRFGDVSGATQSTVTPLHELAETNYLHAYMWYARELHNSVSAIQRRRHEELTMVDMAKGRWAAAVARLKEPYIV